MKLTHNQATISDHNLPLQGGCDMNDNSIDRGKNIIPENIEVQLDREIEKRKIREEIIASEFIRHRQELENEVRKELMIENQILAMRKFGSSEADMKLFAGPSDEYLRINPHHFENYVDGNEKQQKIEEGGLSIRPFDRNPGFVTAVEKVNVESTDEVMTAATQSSVIVGVKRKAETPAIACDEEMTPTMSMDSQNWFCSLCEVSTTSEATLNSHFQGKKHKSKAARSIVDVTTIVTNTLSDAADNSAPPLQTISIASSERETSSDTKKWECALCQLSATSEMLLLSHLQGKKHKAKAAKFQTGEIIANLDGFHSEKPQEMSVLSSNANSIDIDKRWYCSVCGVSASSEKNLNDHLKGKKHKAKAGLSQQGVDSTNQESNEKVPRVKVMKSTNLDGGDSPKHELETKNPITQLTKEEETEVEVTDNSSQKESILGESQGVEELEKQSDASVEFVKYLHCKMCNKGTHDEETMAAHRKSEEHMMLLKKHGGALISVVTIPKKALEGGEIPREGLSAKKVAA